MILANIVESWSLTFAIVVFAVSALSIGLAGIKLTRVTDQLADRMKLGEALAGGVFAGAATSLSGLATTTTAAMDGFPVLAAGNALGSIAAQTTFLVIADMAYPKVNLEHAAASGPNIVYAVLLNALLVLPLMAYMLPDLALYHVHPATILVFIGYLYGLKLVREAQEAPMWFPRRTRETREDVPDENAQKLSLRKLWTVFAICALIVGGAGWTLALAAQAIVRHTELSESMVGAIFTGVTTSLPELITAVVAVRQGALALALGNIIGGNTFDVLQLALADVAYTPGPIYGVMGKEQVFIILMIILMTSVLVLGMFRRQKKGMGNIGFEGVLILLIYALGMGALFLA